MPDTEGLPLYLGIAQSVFPSAGITSVNTPNLQHVSFLMNEVPGVGIVNLLELVKLNTIVKTHHRRQWLTDSGSVRAEAWSELPETSTQNGS